MENLDCIITVLKNWPDDPRMNCMLRKDIKDFMTVENALAEDNYDLIEEVDYFEQLELDGN